MKMKIQLFNCSKSLGYSKSRPEREILRNTSLPKKLEKTPIHKVTLHLKELEKEQQVKPTPSRREIINIWAEPEEMETRRTVEQINKTRSWFFERINKIDKPALLKRRERRLKLIKSWMRKERSLPTPRKYKRF